VESPYDASFRSSRIKVVRSDSEAQNKGIPNKLVKSHRVSEHKSVRLINYEQFVSFYAKVVVNLRLSKKKPVELEFFSISLHHMLV
jgi:hypothetical protein